jgi:hypothetical protein
LPVKPQVSVANRINGLAPRRKTMSDTVRI